MSKKTSKTVVLEIGKESLHIDISTDAGRKKFVRIMQMFAIGNVQRPLPGSLDSQEPRASVEFLKELPNIALYLSRDKLDMEGWKEEQEWHQRKFGKPCEDPENVYQVTRTCAHMDNIEMSEDGIALAFAERHADNARYCHTTGAWFTRTATHWRRDDSMLAFSWARDLCREANRLGLATLKKTATAGAVERAARSDRRLAVTAETWDRDPFLLATPAGVVDLRDGSQREAKPEDYLTKH